MNLKQEIDGIINFIFHEVTWAEKQGGVVGVSGGVDSAVVAILCKKCFPDTTLALRMPLENKVLSDTNKRAVELCHEFDIDFRVELIEEYKYIPKWKHLTHEQILKARGNWYARQRMAKLYMYAEVLNRLVIGTDNKVENFLGFYSKFGDGGVDINPLGQYLKSEVYEMAEYLNVPKSIIKAVPTADLWEGQTDEGELGFSYSDVEKVIQFLEVDNETLEKINSLHLVTEHKRMMPREYMRDKTV